MNTLHRLPVPFICLGFLGTAVTLPLLCRRPRLVVPATSDRSKMHTVALLSSLTRSYTPIHSLPNVTLDRRSRSQISSRRQLFVSHMTCCTTVARLSSLPSYLCFYSRSKEDTVYENKMETPHNGPCYTWKHRGICGHTVKPLNKVIL